MTRPLENLRIVLADDHPVVRMGFRLLLEGAGANVVAEADSGEAALEIFKKRKPDTLVMDISMPGIGGLSALERLLAHTPTARVLMLSAHDDLQMPSRALRAGATGYLSKRTQPQELIRAISLVARGQRYLDPELAQRLALAQLGGASNPAEALTDKELTIFLHLARGLSVTVVASIHNLSPSTVGTHLYHIKKKLDANNSAELTLIALRAGLIKM